MNDQRIKQLHKSADVGECVLYVMSRDQRVRDNHALIAAQRDALQKKLPLAVVFCLRNSKNRAKEHYDFMLDGLRQVETDLGKLGIPFIMLFGDPKEKIKAIIHHTKPVSIYFDFSPLRGSRNLVDELAASTCCSVLVVDTHNIVPAWVASDKLEVGAYTLRPKIHRLLNQYLKEPKEPVAHPYTWPGRVQKINELYEYINEIVSLQKKNNTKPEFASGERAALIELKKFIKSKLNNYGKNRNNPLLNSQSNLSPYLHFGQISSLRVALTLNHEALKYNHVLHLLDERSMPPPDRYTNDILYSIDALIEEMVVRKELADNFCLYAQNYDKLESASHWAINSLNKHRQDTRINAYSYEQLEKASTHDLAWNAAQKQLTSTGKMHGYMRMYWAKKVLEWTTSPEEAIEYLVRLNDFYSIDGGDPNGYAGILWSIAGVHDRPWRERDIFGVIRYMNYEGLKRKFDVETWANNYS